MKNHTKKILKTIIPLFIGLYLGWISIAQFSKAELIEIENSLLQANYWWIGLSIVIGLFSHLSRAYCWKYMLNKMDYHPNFLNRSMAVFVGYFVNLGIPRAGELSRAAVLNQYDEVPFEKAFGTIVAERLADMLIYASFIGIALVIQYQQISDILFTKLPKNPLWLLLIGTLLCVIVFYFIKATKKSLSPFFRKVRKFIKGTIAGVKTILTMKKKWHYMGHMIFIWLAYFFNFYVIIFAFPETQHLPLDGVLVAFIIGTLSFATTNGGIGSYPIAIQTTLLLYHVPETIGASLGWIAWTSQTLLIVLMGAIAFILLPIVNKLK